MTTLDQIKNGELFWIVLFDGDGPQGTKRLLRRIQYDHHAKCVRCVSGETHNIVYHLSSIRLVEPLVLEASSILSTPVDE